MGSMLRSDPMTFCDFYLQVEAAFDTMSELGEMGCVQFLDMNPDVTAFTRNYISEVCRCAEMERKIRYLESEMAKDDIEFPNSEINPKALHPSEMNNYETILEKWEEDISEMSENYTTLMKAYLHLTEFEYVISSVGPMLGDTGGKRDLLFKNLGVEIGPESRLFISTGIVLRSRCFAFEMMLWRVSRGNIYYRQASNDLIYKDPYTNKPIRKVAFVLVGQGAQLSHRLEKIFTGFHVKKYDCPELQREREYLQLDLFRSIADMDQVLKKTRYLRCKALHSVGKQLKTWMIQVRKAKAIYHNMSLFSLDITKNCLIGQCWVPNQDLTRVRNVLELTSETVGTAVPSFITLVITDATPPTYHRTNKFTHGFQALINAYGDSKYEELNPGLCTIITFPFLFALMFADIGHALIVTLFGLWMVVKEKKLGVKSDNEIWNIFFGGRYIILFLGLFSMYTGFVYNDIFSKSICLTRSHWASRFVEDDLSASFLEMDPKTALMHQPYLFGVDPIWAVSINKIMVLNSLKMKISIIFGVMHMMLGLFVSFFNHIHFKNYFAIYLQFIPEITFLICIFLWLVVMIYFKWFMYAGHHPDIQQSAGCAPQILILFIDMVLLSESKPKEEACEAYMFEGQAKCQKILVLIAVLCVPILLFGSPLYLHFFKNRRKKEKEDSQFRKYQRDSKDYKKRDSKEKKEKKPKDKFIQLKRKHEHVHEEHRSEHFSDIMINQGVHTIEFVLSTISHTASYLRLWALSLAHAQLSEMLWQMVLAKLALSERRLMIAVPKLFVIFAVWAAFTISILVLMEGLSAFLHTLRLHWVEYMSKFYTGGGVKFMPYSFKEIMSAEADKVEPGCKMKDSNR